MPLGINHLDVAHELGNIEQTAIEALPVALSPVSHLLGSRIEISRFLLQLLSAELAERVKANHQMVVVAHDGEAGHLAAVTKSVEMNNLQ